MTAGQATLVQQQSGVVWSGIFQPAYKIDAALADPEPGLIKIRTKKNADIAQNSEAVTRAGAAIVRQDGRAMIVLIETGNLVTDLAFINGVAWLEPFTFPETENEYGAGQIMGSTIKNNNGYDGSTQILAVSDTGLGGGTAATAHPDLPAGTIRRCW